jgi:two-component system, cell cycle response regulator
VSPLVLVAEDSATARAAVRIHLQANGYDVVEAEDGRQALEVAMREQPDVILLDVEMPVLDGHAVLAALSADEALSDVPVVVLTGRTDSDDMVACLEAGAHDYLRKPFEMSELIARVSAAARTKHLQDELRRRNEELDFFSRLDGLTGLWTRRHVEERLDNLCSASRRHGFPVSVLVIDLDHFKSINDKHGHGGGDEVLKTAAASIRAHMRGEDVVGRWGGEEFVAVVPYIGAAGARTVAERIRAAIESGSALLEDGTKVQVTASIGLCTRAGEVAHPAELFETADRALYNAKNSGRNQVASCP